MLESIDHQKSGLRLGIIFMGTEFSSTSVKFSIETFLEKIELVATTKHELEYRNLSILINYSGIFALSRFQ